MSRSILRSIKRHQDRQEQALTRYAAERYGPTVSLADLHPDVKMLFMLAFELAQAADRGDQATVKEAVDLLTEFVNRYARQKNVVAPKELDEPAVV